MVCGVVTDIAGSGAQGVRWRETSTYLTFALAFAPVCLYLGLNVCKFKLELLSLRVSGYFLLL